MERSESIRYPVDQSGLLQTLEKSLDDLRAIVTCRICIRPLYEPYTIACGHTFCYGCLRQWFDRDPRRKTCPDCRTVVIREPAPSYLLRDITQIFVTRAELLPPGENTEDHRRLQQQDANAIEQDKGRGRDSSVRRGLFGGRFRGTLSQHVPVIRDEEDGVERCPQCTWELEEGACERCGYGMSDEDDSSFMDDEPSLEQVVERAMAEDDLDLYRMPDGYIDDDISLDDVNEGLDREQPDLYPYEAYYGGPYGAPVPTRARRALERVGARRVDREQNGSVRRWPRLPPSLSPGDDFDDHEGRAFDTESYDSEDDEAGSLDDFIEDDAQGRSVSPTVSSNSHYETDNETATALGYDTNGSNEGFSPLRNDDDDDDARTTESLRNTQDSSEDESEALVHSRSRRQRHVRIISDDDDDDDDNDSPNSNSVVTRDSHISARNGDGTYPRNMDDLPPRLGSQAGSSTQAPIEVDSDSEPVRMSRTQRRRPVAVHYSSDDAAINPSHHPRSSATVHQRHLVVDQETAPSVPRGFSPSFPIALDSSPVRATLAQGRDNSNILRSSTSTNHSRHHRSRGRVSGGFQLSSDSGSLDSEPETEPRPATLEVRSRGSPPQRRITLPSPRSHLPADGSSPAGRVRYRTTPERASSKALRRLAKRHRRRMVREQANNVTQSSEQTAV